MRWGRGVGSAARAKEVGPTPTPHGGSAEELQRNHGMLHTPATVNDNVTVSGWLPPPRGARRVTGGRHWSVREYEAQGQGTSSHAVPRAFPDRIWGCLVCFGRSKRKNAFAASKFRRISKKTNRVQASSLFYPPQPTSASGSPTQGGLRHGLGPKGNGEAFAPRKSSPTQHPFPTH